MRKLLLLACLPLAAVMTHSAYAAETAIGASTDNVFDEFMLEQIEQLHGKRQEEKRKNQSETMKALRAKYPDLDLPARDYYPSLKFYNQTYDNTFTNTIFFAPGSSYLSDVQTQKLASIAIHMAEALELNLIIEAHSADNFQIEEPEDRLFYNRWISGRRAVQIWSYLTREHSINPTRIIMFSFDAQKPLNNGDSESKRALNRRVELRLTSQPASLIPRTRSSNTNPNRTSLSQ